MHSSSCDQHSRLQVLAVQDLGYASCRPSSGGASKLPVLQTALPGAQSPLPAKGSTPSSTLAQLQADRGLSSSSSTKASLPASSAQEQQQPLKEQALQHADQGLDRVVRAPPSGSSAQKQQSPNSSRRQQQHSAVDSMKGTPKKTAHSSSPSRGMANATDEETCQSITASPHSRVHANATTRPVVR